MAVNNKLSAVSKVKSLGLRSGGLSNEGLDLAAMTGMVQTSRSAGAQQIFLHLSPGASFPAKPANFHTRLLLIILISREMILCII